VELFVRTKVFFLCSCDDSTHRSGTCRVTDWNRSGGKSSKSRSVAGPKPEVFRKGG
jgi:hypothetical protein